MTQATICAVAFALHMHFEMSHCSQMHAHTALLKSSESYANENEFTSAK